jgi:hypothetical protein
MGLGQKRIRRKKQVYVKQNYNMQAQTWLMPTHVQAVWTTST